MSNNTEMVSCGTCKGAKFMMKLGGIYGECNTCLGKGEVSIPKPIVLPEKKEPELVDIKTEEELEKLNEKLKSIKGSKDGNKLEKRKTKT